MTRILTFLAVLCASAAPASAVTVTFTGDGGAESGIIGHDAVSVSETGWASQYSARGVAFLYTALVSPDAWNASTGTELPIGTNAPATSFGASAAAPHGLETLGITGTVHIGIAGLTLDYASPADLFFTDAFHETRFYRGGTARILEETAPGAYTVLAEFTDLVMEVNIDYSTGEILTSTSATRTSGTSDYFPELWLGRSFDPIDVIGSSPEGPYGGFSTETTMEFDVAKASEPAALAALGLGLAAFGVLRRRRAG